MNAVIHVIVIRVYVGGTCTSDHSINICYLMIIWRHYEIVIIILRRDMNFGSFSSYMENVNVVVFPSKNVKFSIFIFKIQIRIVFNKH